MKLNRDKIDHLAGSFGSGLVLVAFQSGRQAYGDNGPTVRALEAATADALGRGRAIGEGHTINNKGIKGLDICWYLDDFGLTLGGFVLTKDHHELRKIPLGGSAEVTEENGELKVEVLEAAE